jgi:hypothetical protein
MSASQGGKMGTVGKKVIGAVVGVLLFIAIMEVRDHLGGSGDTSETTKISEKDVSTYLQVMRASADRVKNPTAEDRATIDAFNQIPNVHTAKANELSEDQKNTIFRAIELTGQLDEVVASEQNITGYKSAKEAVESVLPAPDVEAPPLASGGLTDSEKKALSSRNARALSPYAQEIRSLQIEIYNSPLRKAVKGS